ncbi:MAG: hypothetical protein R3217_05005 [Gammaproteobacteria bacterium]|nr:hypothetical protein [Gammaproteobacteria bacterium]
MSEIDEEPLTWKEKLRVAGLLLSAIATVLAAGQKLYEDFGPQPTREELLEQALADYRDALPFRLMQDFQVHAAAAENGQLVLHARHLEKNAAEVEVLDYLNFRQMAMYDACEQEDVRAYLKQEGRITVHVHGKDDEFVELVEFTAEQCR